MTTRKTLITLVAGITVALVCAVQPVHAKDAPTCINIYSKWHDSSGWHVRYKNGCSTAKYVQPAWKFAPDGKCKYVQKNGTAYDHHRFAAFQKLKDCGG